MTKKEKQIQKALGLFKMYDGYVKMQGNTYFDVYEVQDVNLAGAKRQLGEIMAKLQQKYKRLFELYFIQENDSNEILPLSVRRNQISGIRHNIKN